MPITEKLKLWAAAFLTLAVVYVAAYAELSFGVKFGAVTAGGLLAGALVFFSQGGRDFSRFVRDSLVELRKVVWPTKQETLQLTGVVFLFLIAASLFLWFADFVIGHLLDALSG